MSATFATTNSPSAIFSEDDESQNENFAILESSKRAAGTLADFCELDLRFSEMRCQKALPLAVQAYQEGLQGHYVEEIHNAKVRAI